MPKYYIFRNKYSKLRFLLNLLFSITIIYISITDCIAQRPFTLSQPKLSVSNDNLIIKYDILGANQDDRFYIWIEVTDSLIKRVGAYSLDGDIGDSIKAGRNKQIIWNLQADNIFVDNTFNIEIFAEKLFVPEIVPEEKDIVEKPLPVVPEKVSEEKDVVEKPVPASTKIKTGKHLLQSAVFPGWGLTSLSNGKPYWLLGVAGMGCLATSYYYYQESHSSYDKYKESSDDDITGYYDDAILQGNISKALALSTAAIWVVDLGIVTIKAISMNRTYKRDRAGPLSINPSIDLITDTPVFTVRYKF